MKRTSGRAIDARLRACDIAHRDAHDYFSSDPDDRPISVRRVNTDLSPEEYEDYEEVGNLGSYIGKYIGSYGEELFKRNIEELIFRASCWATGTQMVRFSTGANELINLELDCREADQGGAAPTDDSSDQIETIEAKESDGGKNGDNWSILGIG